MVFELHCSSGLADSGRTLKLLWGTDRAGPCALLNSERGLPEVLFTKVSWQHSGKHPTWLSGGSWRVICWFLYLVLIKNTLLHCNPRKALLWVKFRAFSCGRPMFRIRRIAPWLSVVSVKNWMNCQFKAELSKTGQRSQL